MSASTEDSFSRRAAFLENVRPELAPRAARYYNRLAVAGIPDRFRDYTLPKLKETDAFRPPRTSQPGKATSARSRGMEAAEAFARDRSLVQRGQPRFCLFFSGAFGTGKTTLATATLKEMMWVHDEPGRWLKFYAFCRFVQAGYSSGEADERISQIQRCNLLLLDDVGDLARDRAETDDKRQILYEVLDYRNDYMLPTILTTNLDEAALVEQFGERTFQRVLEMSAMIVLSGDNLRLLK